MLVTTDANKPATIRNNVSNAKISASCSKPRILHRITMIIIKEDNHSNILAKYVQGSL